MEHLTQEKKIVLMVIVIIVMVMAVKFVVENSLSLSFCWFDHVMVVSNTFVLFLSLFFVFVFVWLKYEKSTLRVSRTGKSSQIYVCCECVLLLEPAYFQPLI